MFNLKALIVEDDFSISELIALYLHKAGFDIKQIDEGTNAIREFIDYQPNIVLLDLMLPGKDGYSICREIRKMSAVPVIILTAKGDTFDKVLGFEVGADDYLVKPFDPEELIARVRAVLKRYSIDPSKDTKSLTYGDLTIEPESFSVYQNGAKVPMARKEFEILLLFMSNPNKVYTREQLLNIIWGYDYYGDTRTVDVHIKRIREQVKFTDEMGIKTVRSVGYKFVV